MEEKELHINSFQAFSSFREGSTKQTIPSRRLAWVVTRNFVLLLIFILLGNRASAQQVNYTLNKDYLWTIESAFNDTLDTRSHTFVKPYRYSELNKIGDSALFSPSLFKNKKGTIAQATTKKINWKAYPLVISQVGIQRAPNRLTNELAIGGNIMANVGKKLSLNLKMIAGRGVFNTSVDSLINEESIIAGRGFAYKENNDSLNPAYSYQNTTGYLSFSPNKIFNFQIGRDKHFWGDGYRSLFLSDVAAPYPFFKITTKVWKLTYVNLSTAMTDATTNPSGLKADRLTKYATFHYLGWNATKRITIGLFESVVWQGTDNNRNRGYDVTYMNPVLFFRPAEYSLGSSDNVLIGLSGKIKLFKKQQIYGQLLLDEFVLKELVEKTGWWANKYALQAGFKSFDLFKINNLNFQTEVNYVRPYTYAHGSVQQSYTHMNQPLAHPMGANFEELTSLLNYRHKRLFIEGKVQYAVYGIDTDSISYGKNLSISYVNRPSEFGHFVAQGTKTKLATLSLKGAYILDSHMNLKIELGGALRIESNEFGNSKTPYVFIGLRTDLGNLYNDF